MTTSSLSDRCREILLGSLLGDGSLKIHKPYRNARFSFRHSIKNREYFLWKVNELKEISSEKCLWEQKDGKFRYQSVATEALTDLYRLTSPHRRLKIRRRWLNQLTPLSLCVWWLDDGSLVSDCRQGVLCTDGFAYDDLITTVRYFRKVWGLHFRIGAVAKQGPRASQYRLWLRSADELKKFLRIVMPHVPVASMLYKVLMLYKDPVLQQRWISEVCENTMFNHEMIEACVRQRKEKLAVFRK